MVRAGEMRFKAALLAAAIATSAPALAEKAKSNAVESAEDAFGTSVPHETIGIYDASNVRGFSPGSAGNFRMEGLYIDIEGGLSSRILGGETIRVGTAAQGYAFPAPTGIVDLSLRKADGELAVTPFISGDSFGSRSFEVDASIPLDGKRLGLSGGFGVYDSSYANGTGSQGFNLGSVLRWRPQSGAELLAFANHQQFWNQTNGAIFIPTGNFLPPPVEFGRFLGPSFARSSSRSDAFGVLGHVSMGDWTLRGGLFHSQFGQGTSFTSLVFVNANASTDRQIIARPANGSGAWSGELRLSRRLRDGPRQHLLTLDVRGRSVDGDYGGSDRVDLGPAGLNDRIEPGPPGFNFTAKTGDQTRQITGGIAYGLNWKGLGEFTMGLIRTRYEKRVSAPGLPLARGVSSATLPYFTVAAPVTARLIAYGSYMRGLEDAGSAPGFAANANQVLPAIRTRQYDFGIRWSPVKTTTVILGYFAITKPYIDLDKTNRYGVLGDETHKGIEASLTTNPFKNLRIVAGGVWQQPRVIASPTIAQPVGAKPVGQIDLRTRFNANWTLPFAPSVTLDAYVNHDSSAVGTVDNSVIAPGSTRVGVGARYRFKLGGKPFTARVAMGNIANVFEFIPIGAGVYGYNTKRNVSFYLTADL